MQRREATINGHVIASLFLTNTNMDLQPKSYTCQYWRVLSDFHLLPSFLPASLRLTPRSAF